MTFKLFIPKTKDVRADFDGEATKVLVLERFSN